MEKIEFSLLIAQVVVLALSQLIYSLQKSAYNLEKRDRGLFAPQVTDALRLAHEARQEVTNLNTHKYESVRSDLIECCKENAKLKAQVSGLEESIANLSNKLASRDRADTMALRRARQAASEAEDEPEKPTPAPTPSSLEEAIASGVAIPLSSPNGAPLAPSPIPPGFGRKIGGK